MAASTRTSRASFASTPRGCSNDSGSASSRSNVRDAIGAVVAEVGLDRADFERYVDSGARADLDACFVEADRDRIFGVPTFVVDGEPFWGEDRIDWVVKKLDALDLRR